MRAVHAFITLAATMLLLAGCTQPAPPRACTMEAKICPDGSAVGRVGPNCEFAPCPNATGCENNSVDSCPAGCEVCPPCEACSSISCHAAQYCRAIGFNSTWYNKTANPNCACPDGYVKDGDVCNPQCYYSTPQCLIASVPCSRLA